MKTPIVTIQTGLSLADYYEQILHSIDQRFHSYQTTFPRYPETEEEAGRRESFTAHASHASDGLIVNGHMASTDGGKTWQHIERLLR